MDPRQQRFFKTNDLHELFTLNSGKTDREHGTETGAIFSSTATEVNKHNYFDQHANKVNKQKPKSKLQPSAVVDEEEMEADGVEASLSEERKHQLMEMAKRISKRITRTEVKGATSKKPSKGSKKLFDGLYKIPHLRRQKTMQEKIDEEQKNSKEQDDYVLYKLLGGKDGVHSALRHDQIIQGGCNPDLQLIEDEAEIVARRASEVLKSSLR